MIAVEVTGTADATDALDGTDLQTIPGPGGLTIFVASTQLDTLLTITGPGSEPVVRNRPMLLRAGPEIRQDEDVAYMIPVVQGGRYIINVDVTTAATFRVRAIYEDLHDLGLAK